MDHHPLAFATDGQSIVIDIRESDTQSQAVDSIEVSLTFGYPSSQEKKGGKDTTFPSCTRKLSLPRPREESEIVWLLEDFINEPFSTSRAGHARAFIHEQASTLFHQLGIDDDLLVKHGYKGVIIEISEGGSISRLHWEALETRELWQSGIEVKVCRISIRKDEIGPLQRAPTQRDSLTKLNVLLVVARGERDIDHRLTALPLVQKLQKDASQAVTVDIARPGTKEAFLECLRTKDYHIVHFDMHGAVKDGQACLLFKHPSTKQTVKVSADEIGHALFSNRVKLVVMNACQSASTMTYRNAQANFASQLAAFGVSFVVGMAYQVSDSAVEIFHDVFYDCILFKADDVLSAVHKCREALAKNKTRAAQSFQISVQLEDHIVPALYTNSSHMEKTTPFVLNREVQEPPVTASDAPEIDCPGPETSHVFVGRDYEMLELENELLGHRVCLVQGPYGVGKWTLLANLSQWFEESRLVERVFILDCSSGTPSAQTAYATLYGQIPVDQGISDFNLHQDSQKIQDILDRYVRTHDCMLIVRDIEDRPEWIANLVLNFAFPIEGSCASSHGGLVALCSRKELSWISEAAQKRNNPAPFRFNLKGLSNLAATSLADHLSTTAKNTAILREKGLAGLWYKQRSLELLQYSPLAIEMIMAEVGKTDASAVYWRLQTSGMPLEWEKEGAKRLLNAWLPLLNRHREVLMAFIPFQVSVPGELLTQMFPPTSNGPNLAFQATTQALQDCGAASIETGSTQSQIANLRFHPLFCQFLRAQTWTEDNVHQSWHHPSVYYHNKSLQWIQEGMYRAETTAQLRTEWQNLVAILDKLISELGTDSDDSALFDLVWILCSFHVFYKDMPRFSEDAFADITMAALHQIVPEFAVTGNYAWQILIQAGLQSRARELTDFQLCRAIMFCQFLVQYFYDVSLATARAYLSALSILLESVERQGEVKGEFGILVEVATRIAFLTEAEFATEEGCLLGMGKNWADFKIDESLPSGFQQFADIWSQTQTYRSIGFHPDFENTFTNLAKKRKGELPQSEYKSRLEPFQVLFDTFQALNGDEAALAYGTKQVETRLREAVENGDSRKQMDIYEKLAELYTKSRDWDAVLYVLSKIDECAQDLEGFYGFKVDEISILRRQLWTTTRKAQCLKYLGRMSESKASIQELRGFAARREELWTKEDRAKEGVRNMGAVVEHHMAEAAQKSPEKRLFEPTGVQEYLAGGLVFMTQRYYSEEASRPPKTQEMPEETAGARFLVDDPLTDPVADETSGTAFDIKPTSNHLIEGVPGIDTPTTQHSTPAEEVDNNSDMNKFPGQIPTDRDDDDEESDHENDDADDLYLILNPWMKKPLAWMGNLGGTPGSEFVEFQIPPGHVGGFFLLEARRLMAEAVLRAIGVRKG